MDDLKTDVRQDLDNLKTDVSQRFTDTHKRLDNLHAEMNQRFDQVNRELAENRERMAKLEGALEASSPGAATATQRNARAQHRPSRNTAPGAPHNPLPHNSRKIQGQSTTIPVPAPQPIHSTRTVSPSPARPNERAQQTACQAAPSGQEPPTQFRQQTTHPRNPTRNSPDSRPPTHPDPSRPRRERAGPHLTGHSPNAHGPSSPAR